MGKIRDIMVVLVMWLTRAGGVVLSIGGLGFFVSAWQAHFLALVALGIIALEIGATLTSIRASQGNRLEYGLFRPTHRS